MKFASLVTDQGELIYEGDALIEGIEVFVENEGGEIVVAPDGEYVAEDRKVIVKDGKVESIEEIVADPEPEPQNDPEPENLDEKDEKIAELEAKIEELNNTIADKDAYIAELEGKLNAKEEELSAANAKLKESADKSAKDKLKFSKEQVEKNPALKYFN
jgi:uncharacterized coiled-coil protein SlyX